jgi:hypothetical protein
MPTTPLRELDFDIVKEPWNKYELSDGAILKTRIILQKVKHIEQENRTGYGTDFTPLQVIFAPAERKGTPSNQTYTEQELASSIDQELRYNTTAEEWNEYVVDDGTRIRVEITVTRVSRTTKFDQYGDPIYLVETSGLGQNIQPRRYS